MTPNIPFHDFHNVITQFTTKKIDLDLLFDELNFLTNLGEDKPVIEKKSAKIFKKL